MNTTKTPRVYVADLNAYNRGQHRGAWVDVVHEDLKKRLAELLNEWDGEEHAFHAFEYMPKPLRSQHQDVARLNTYGRLVEEHGREQAAAFIEALGYGELGDPRQWTDKLWDAYLGVADSIEDWAYERLQSTGRWSKLQELGLARYIDLEAMARDMEIDSYETYVEKNGNVHVFATDVLH